jgi:hypothetical protein
MRTLKALVLAAGIGCASLASSQAYVLPDPPLPGENSEPGNIPPASIPKSNAQPHETDQFKFIPLGSVICKIFGYPSKFGPIDGIWYNPDCKNKIDYDRLYEKNEKKIPKDQLFIDVGGDGKPDISLEDLEKNYDFILKDRVYKKIRDMNV